jgi:FlaA1/EpsC-like NDP-sugar epimerase
MRRAVQLILCAGAEAKEGEIYVAEMGKPRKIQELARELILLSGADPEKDIAIQIAGLRSGEKLLEEITTRYEKPRKTRFEGLFAIEPANANERVMRNQISKLIQSARSSDRDSVHRILTSMSLGYTHVPEKPAQDLETTTVIAVMEDDPSVESKRSDELSQQATAGTSRS